MSTREWSAYVHDKLGVALHTETIAAEVTELVAQPENHTASSPNNRSRSRLTRYSRIRVREEAARRGVDLAVIPTEDACRLIAGLDNRQVHAVPHVTC